MVLLAQADDPFYRYRELSKTQPLPHSALSPQLHTLLLGQGHVLLQGCNQVKVHGGAKGMLLRLLGCVLHFWKLECITCVCGQHSWSRPKVNSTGVFEMNSRAS